MINTITVAELISQLSKFDGEMPVVVSAVGFNASDSWDAALELSTATISENEGVIRINFGLY